MWSKLKREVKTRNDSDPQGESLVWRELHEIFDDFQPDALRWKVLGQEQ